ncbi:Transcriptional regulator, AbiEi antitoxin, Type IV TA system [Sanguibacter gelidistatuariae]|uniref:Transcriptional regulator, AbiEi antitoxin, Type IV TA system n=1 Tax=Sanguibacter gelidistatuariae TaxID=1814289 RepID=A0A1G6K2G1_9MICO|nr:type IV toxin-antitoxin system AbiEi family antitoxin domain-containing protein [Sanguibacter gelidistatuariae]SDC24795.1 Transcriptional regulator, AbiEi antitoxin, Type IV TA system [Sanguibacter gelidistatuariae]
MRTAVIVRANELAAAQWGLFTAAQAQTQGLSRMQLSRMVDAGLLDRLEYGVYASPAVQGDHLLPLRSAWLALQPARSVQERLADLPSAGVVSHSSAAQLHGLGDLLADEHEFLLPDRFQSRRVGVRMRRAVLDASEVTIAAGLPVTTAARTIADLLAIGHDNDHVATVTADALRLGLTDRRTLAVALENAAARRGEPSGAALVEILTRTHTRMDQ